MTSLKKLKQRERVVNETSPLSVANSFVNLCEDPSINKDAKFLDDLDALLTNNDTNEIFMPNIKKLRAVYRETRKKGEKEDWVSKSGSNIGRP